MPPESPMTLFLLRCTALLAALRDGPLARPDLLARLGDAYPRTASARPMVDRDVKHLAELGIVIEISRTRPPVYTLHGGTPAFDTADLRALALIRDTFGDRHPQSAQMHALLQRLTSQLGEVAQRTYQRRQARRAPVQPAVDYTPYDALIRESPHIAVERSFSGERVAEVLDQVAQRIGLPQAIQVDNGPEFTSKALDEWAARNKVKLVFSRPGTPTDNPYIEAFNGRLRAEWLEQHWFASLEDARTTIEAWRVEYNTERPHTALNTQAPAVYRAAWERERQLAETG